MRRFMDNSTRKKLITLLAECVNNNTTFIDETINPEMILNMDSIELLDYILLIEDEFGIDFRDFSALSQHMSTVTEMIDFLEEFITSRKEGGSHGWD